MNTNSFLSSNGVFKIEDFPFNLGIMFFTVLRGYSIFSFGLFMCVWFLQSHTADGRVCKKSYYILEEFSS